MLQVVDVIKTAEIVVNKSGLSFRYMTVVHDNNPCQCPVSMRQKIYTLMATRRKALLWRSVVHLGGMCLAEGAPMFIQKALWTVRGIAHGSLSSEHH